MAPKLSTKDAEDKRVKTADPVPLDQSEPQDGGEAPVGRGSSSAQDAADAEEDTGPDCDPWLRMHEDDAPSRAWCEAERRAMQDDPNYHPAPDGLYYPAGMSNG